MSQDVLGRFQHDTALSPLNTNSHNMNWTQSNKWQGLIWIMGCTDQPDYLAIG